ncbi:hypothetical protein D9758_002192 [Tetrapyrgos nigripes]|uniref:Riboflavin synthase n=1 Tax=Tetrapyrgos nigripes TaxID=182062 RepID=A0A8H5GNV4_9AGAR|nr:hypothetical protein D9758_002192 [Tetrapyrgos nigripes]
MFTGLIEHLGTVTQIDKDSNGCTLVIGKSGEILGDCKIGDSIAVNGCCLTVTEFDAKENGGWFKVWLANETLERSDLGDRKTGDQVNLERAMGAHVRFGGHFVQGHVDGTATIVERDPDGDSVRLTFEFGEDTLLRYLVEKGYVTIDGASLTVTFVDDTKKRFGIMLIQHTQEKITLGRKEIGSRVNIEVDMVGKYVEKSVTAALGGSGGEGLRKLVEKVVTEFNAVKVPVNLLLEDSDGCKTKGGCLRTAAEQKLNKGQVTSKLAYNDSVRPPSPLKSYVSSSSPAVIRPKAKVNSSATPSTLRKPPKSTPVRPSSPSKLPKLQPSNSSSTQPPRIRAVKSTSLRPQTAQSTPTTPILGSNSRPRFGSVSLHPDSYSPPRADSIFASSDIDTLSDTGAAPRIKAKVSRAAKHASVDVASLYPSSPSVLSPSHRVRAPSISSATSAPILRSTNIARSSPSPPAQRFTYQPFSSPATHDLDDTIHVNSYRYTPKVDPASIPLPPHSPPVSAVSFSSRSSVSHSSVSQSASQSTSTTSSLKHNNDVIVNGVPDLRGTLDTLLLFNDVDDTPSVHTPADTKATSEERKVVDEAKSNRKIADLEITNRSLLAINSSLEATKHRQAKEIRELRRKLRESRLILPPRTYRAVTSKDKPTSPTGLGLALDDDLVSDPDADPEEDSDPENPDTYLDKANNRIGYHDYLNDADDETYRRLRLRMNDLIETGQRALEMKPKDFVDKVGNGGNWKKVLSAEEVRDWRGSEGEGEYDPDKSLLEPTTVLIGLEGDERRRRKSYDEREDEELDEVEAMMIPRDSVSPSPTPDILVTRSH